MPIRSVITRITNHLMESGILLTDLKVASVKPPLRKQSLSLVRRNREKIGGPLSRTPTRRREKRLRDASKPVARHFNLPYHSNHNMTICGLSLHHAGTQKAAKVSNKNSSFNWVHFLHTALINASHSTNLFTNSADHISTNGKAPHTLM